MHLVLKFYMSLDFDYIFYGFRDINDNYFNLPISQLRNLQKFVKHILIHAPHSEIVYAVLIFVILSIMVFEKMGLPFCRGRRGRGRRTVHNTNFLEKWLFFQ